MSVFLRLFLVLSGFSLLTLSYAHAPASAQSAQCSRLQSQLATAGRRTRNPRYARAAQQQRYHLRRLDRSMRRRGCGSGGGLRCRAMASTRKRMQANLARLSREAGSGGGASRRSIRRHMRKLGCGTRTAERRQRASRKRERSRAQRKRARIARLNRSPVRSRLSTGTVRKTSKRTGGRKTRIASLTPSVLPPNLGAGARVAGAVRTICVRTCDGYAFPVSHSTRGAQITLDAQACASMCPGQATELFTKPVGSVGMAEARSLANGTLYASLPAAFSFQQSFRGECACQRSSTAAAGPGLSDLSVDKGRAMGRTLPRFRTSYGADPETAALQRSGSYMRDAARMARGSRDRAVERFAQNRRVRVVGESFLPDR